MKRYKFKYIIVLLMQVAVCTSSGQNALSWEQNSYRDGDSLVKARVAKVTAGERGEGRVWQYDTSNLTAEYIMKYRCLSDTAVCVEHDTRYYYRQHDDSLLLCGFENRLSKFNFIERPCHLRMPFAYGDSISGAFSAIGLYGERLHIGLWGKTYVTGDGTGILTDNTDTLNNILRLHRHTETVRVAQTEPFDTLRMCRDSIENIVAISSDRLIEDRYLWYMRGYRYPIMETVEVTTLTDGMQKPYLATTFLYIPVWQENELPFDFANNSLRHTDETQTDYSDGNGEGRFLTSLKATANTANNSVRISYTQPESGTLRITVCDKSGILLVSSTFTHDAGYYEEDIPLPKSVNNVLLLYVSYKDKVKSLKISQ